MIALSQTAGYAIQALSCLSESRCECRLIADIAECSGVPRAYLAKVLNSLARRGLVNAKRGCRGGVTLARKPVEIRLLDVVEAVEDSHWISDCLLNLPQCGDKPECPTSKFWKGVRREITDELHLTTLADVIAWKRKRAAARREQTTGN